eukprot:m.106071 g.106071  ORF g.106071 m.106071 type:complete len:115 (-) comp16889_c0_seq10:436-780(-)
MQFEYLLCICAAIVAVQEKNGDERPDGTDLALATVLDTRPLVEWLAENYADFGIKIEIISNRSPEGTQFCMGFGGLGAILRHPIEEFYVSPMAAEECCLEESLAQDGVDIDDYM